MRSMAKSWGYVDRSGEERTARDFDRIVLEEMFGDLDPWDALDPRVTPWKRRHVATLRARLAD
jgi:hypothetical protein